MFSDRDKVHNYCELMCELPIYNAFGIKRQILSFNYFNIMNTKSV